MKRKIDARQMLENIGHVAPIRAIKELQESLEHAQRLLEKLDVDDKTRVTGFVVTEKIKRLIRAVEELA